MARWDPGAAERLQQAALELFEEHGFEQVTTAQITERAGLTRRSFFRYYADNREVLFAGSEQLPILMAEAVVSVPGSASAAEAALAAVAEGGARLTERLDPERALRRHRVIEASPALLERERAKLADVAGALGGALRERGADPETAGLLAEVAIVVFRTAFRRWVLARGADDFGVEFERAVGMLRGSFAEDHRV